MFHQQTCRIFTLCNCVCVEDQCCWWSPSSSWGQMFSVQLMWREMLDLWLALFFQSMILTMLLPVQVCFHRWNRLSAAAGQRRNTNIHHRVFHTGHRNMNTWHLSSVSNDCIYSCDVWLCRSHEYSLAVMWTQPSGEHTQVNTLRCDAATGAEVNDAASSLSLCRPLLVSPFTLKLTLFQVPSLPALLWLPARLSCVTPVSRCLPSCRVFSLSVHVPLCHVNWLFWQ